MKWILVQPVGGLCNRLRVLVSSLILAECMERNLQLLWRPDAACNCEFYSLFQPSELIQVVPYWRDKLAHFLASRFCIPVPSVTLPFLSTESGKGIVINQEYLNKLDYKINLHDFKDFSFILFQKCFSDFIPTHFSAENYSEKVSYYLNHLKPIESFTQKLFDLPSFTVGVHIRRTDNRASTEKSSLDMFIKEMNQCLRVQPQTRFFLATDEPEVEKKLKEIFTEKIITFSKSSYDRSQKVAIQEALVDLLLLSKCERILGSYYSSFSEYASLFRLIPLNLVGVGFWKGPAFNILARSMDESPGL